MDKKSYPYIHSRPFIVCSAVGMWVTFFLLVVEVFNPSEARLLEVMQ